jgi:divalent metal cation (Fe/Co/Zn/Cd) transporter
VDGEYHVEAHVTANDRLSLAQAHSMASQLENAAKARIPHLAEIVTHIEPASKEHEPPYVSPLSTEQITEAIRGQLAQMYSLEKCHNLEVYRLGDEGWACSLHCLMDGQLSLNVAHTISAQIEGRLRDAIPRLNRVVVHTEPLESDSRQVASSEIRAKPPRTPRTLG